MNRIDKARQALTVTLYKSLNNHTVHAVAVSNKTELVYDIAEKCSKMKP